MTKFFLEKSPVRKAPPDYRVISYFKVIEYIKKIKLYTIQKLIRKLKKHQSSDPALEQKLKTLKECQPRTLRKIAVYFLKSAMNLNLERKEEFFRKMVGGEVEDAVAEIAEDENNKGAASIILEAMRKNPKFEELENDIQQLLGKVEKKMTQTKQKKESKKIKIKIKKQLKQKKQEEEGIAIQEQQEQPKIQKQEQQQDQEQNIVRAAPKTKHIHKKNTNEDNKPKIKTRYDNKPKPRSQFKKKGRNKYLNQKKKTKQYEKQQQVEPPTNKYLNPNQTTHPSWQAKLQQNKIVPFQGKKIVFT